MTYFSLEEEFTTYGEQAVFLGRQEEVGRGTLTGRIPLWQESLRSVDQRPLLGYGYNSYLSPKNIVRISRETGWVAASLHSGYFEVLLGLGYIGLVTLVLLLFLAVKRSVVLAKRDFEYAFMPAVFVWLCINLWFESELLTRPYFMAFVWMILMAKLGFLPENKERSELWKKAP